MSKLKKYICYWFGHRVMQKNTYFPSIDAPVVTRWDQEMICTRCGWTKTYTYLYDED